MLLTALLSHCGALEHRVAGQEHLRAGDRRGVGQVRRVVSPLEDRSGSHSAADAHAHDTKARGRAPLLHLAQKRRGTARAGRAERVTQRDRASVGVDLVLVEVELRRAVGRLNSCGELAECAKKEKRKGEFCGDA